MSKFGKRRYVRITVLLAMLCAAAIAAQQRMFDPLIYSFAQSTQPEAPVSPAEAARAELRAKIQSEARQPIDPSPWREADKQRYAALLSQGKPEVLVMPFQISTAPKQLGIDLSARMIMAHMTAQRIGAFSKAKVADVELVSRALGEPRYLTREDALSFGKRLGVTTVFYGQTWHDGNGKLFVRLTKIAVSTGQDEAIAVAEPVAISDEVTPELAFREVADNLARQVGIDSKLDPQMYSIRPTYFPDSPVVATSITPSNPVEGIWIQELIGTLSPLDSDRGAARVFERAFAALDFVSPDSPDYKLLNARALLRLNRRPAALRMIGTPRTPEEEAFLEYINGNLPDMTSAVSKINRPLPKLMAEMDLVALRISYLDDDEAQSITGDYAKSAPLSWQPTIFWNAALLNNWGMRSTVEMKKVMDAHFPLAGQSAEELLKGKAVAGSPSEPKVAVEVEGMPFVHSDNVLAQKGALWCCAPQSWQPRPFQYLDLLYNLSEAMLIHTAKHWHRVQGQADQAVKIIDLLNEVIFKNGNLRLQYRKMDALADLLDNERDTTRSKALANRLYETAKQVRTWQLADGGMVVDAVNAEKRAAAIRFGIKQTELAYPDLNVLRLDFPPTYGLLRTSGAYITAINTAKDIDVIQRACNYSQVGMRACFAYRTGLMAAGRAEDADRYEKEYLMARFHGNPYAMTKLLNLMIERGESESARAFARNVIAKTPKTSAGYFQLGTIAAETGDYLGAQKFYLSFPPFTNSEKTNTVGLSNKASWAAARLAVRGAAKEARPLYEIAAGFENGSGASYEAALKLAYMDRRFGDGQKIALRSVQHYAESGNIHDYLALLFATGNSADGWASAKEANVRFASSGYWWALRPGFRIDNANEATVSAWVNEIGQLPVQPGADRDGNGLTALTIAASLLSMDRDSASIKTIGRVRDRAFPNYKPQELTSPEAAQRNTGIGEHLDYLERFVAGYAAFKEGKYQTVCDVFQNWPVAGRTRAAAELFVTVLPYYAYSAAKSGQLDRFKAYLEKYRKPLRYTPLDGDPVRYSRFDVYAADAIVYFMEGNHVEANRRLLQARAIGQPNGLRPLPPEYVFAEISEILAADSGVKNYLDPALEWAKSTQLDKPWEAWAYAFEAKHGKNDDERAKAYAIARYLDKNSSRLVGIDPKIVKKADDWLLKNKPFPRDSAGKSTAS